MAIPFETSPLPFVKGIKLLPESFSSNSLSLLPISIIVGSKSTKEVTTDDLTPFFDPGIEAIMGT